MLMSALPMTQFWSVGSSAHQYSCSPTVAFILMRLANETTLVSSSRSITIYALHTSHLISSSFHINLFTSLHVLIPVRK